MVDGVVKLKLYLDNCCFNRPFDDQTQLTIYLESQAKLFIQHGILSGTFQLVPDSTTTDLTLPTAGTNGSTITWATDNESVIAADGTVTRPASGQPDATVTLTATASKGTATDSREFTVTVPALT